jgi:NAD(P)-dependent dehydrogenase (short-subunit alcohol dehydrogenase family)
MPQKTKKKRPLRPAQHQRRQPGFERRMRPRPKSEDESRPGSGRLAEKVAVITGGDSGIGRAVAIAFAREGADVAIVYLNEHVDARETAARVEAHGRRCLTIAGVAGDAKFCRRVVDRTVAALGHLDVLVNNAAEQHPQESALDITPRQLERTFRTNVFSYFFMTRAALPHLKEGAAIVNTTSVTAYRGSDHLIDYASTKGAIVSFTRSLSHALVEKKIRVNGVAPGPIWTPLNPSGGQPPEKIPDFGKDVPMGRPGQPNEVAPAFLFLACEDSSYMSGQVLHPNGGTVVNG